ncbi:hypothetical protein [Agromyces larvae]|uniref:Uncharacterized protein n=1 Tax=Agromyces larvae TaxID=2929802 RepID=A0ABY4BWL0_9MICO|nr:hypothetical protein [Agromyces larvae]UOE43534.1 hypothetical protein MTO99_15335 [Agromyces larvae]
MYHTSDLMVLHLHESLLERSERELEIRRRIAERDEEEGGAAGRGALRHRRAHRVPRLALR